MYYIKKAMYIDKLLSSKERQFDTYKMDKEISEAGLAYIDSLIEDKNKVETLSVTFLANQSGKLVNMRVYPAKLMRDGYKLWKDGITFNKKVHYNHDPGLHPIGNVTKARFVPRLKGDALKYDYKNPAIEETENGSADGILTLGITNPDAIRRVLRGEYDAVSTGMDIWPIVCSICGNTLFSGCGHYPGEYYPDEEDKKKTKLCYGIASKWIPLEVSLVSIPAFSLSKVLSINDVPAEDSKNIDDDFNKSIHSTKVELIAYDGKLSHNLSDEWCNMPKTKSISINLDALINKDNAEDINEPLEVDGNTTANTTNTTTETNDEPNKTDDKKQADNKDKNATDGTTTHSHVDPPASTDPIVDDTNKDATDDNEKPIFETDEDFAVANILYSIDKENMLDYEVEIEGDTLTLFDIEEAVDKIKSLADLSDEALDKKLTTKQRKSLKTSQFCGPGRSFPVPDCAHVTAAKRLLNRSKYSEETKKKILACVNRKAKSLGCDSSKDMLDIDITRLQDEKVELTKKVDDLEVKIQALSTEINSIKKIAEDKDLGYKELVEKISPVIRHYLRIKNADNIDENTMDFDTLLSKAVEIFNAEAAEDKTKDSKQVISKQPTKKEEVQIIPGTEVKLYFRK